jgi:glutathione S-transferase
MMLAAPATLLSAAVTVLAVLLLAYMIVPVGRARGKHNIPAPAMTGHPDLERAVRVHMNTIEQFVIFLPLLWVATIYFNLIGWLAPAFGLVWIVGRIMYMRGYLADPAKRSTGFLVTMVASIGLLVLSVIGVVMAWIAMTAA